MKVAWVLSGRAWAGTQTAWLQEAKLLPGFLTCMRQGRQNKACQKYQTGHFMQCVYGRDECKHKYRNMRGCSA